MFSLPLLAAPSVPLARVLPVLAWMGLPVLAGFLAWQWGLRRRPGGAALAAGATGVLSRAVLVVLTPLLMVVLFWPARIPLSLPLIGLFAHLFGGAVGYGLGRFGRLDRGGRGAFFLCGACSNILSFGGITTLFLVGPHHPGGPDGALSDLALYRVFETPLYFLFAWPVFALFAPRDDNVPRRRGAAFRQAVRPAAMMPVAGIVVGCLLNVSGAPMPAWLAGAAAPLVKLTTLTIGATVGLTLRAASPRRYLGTCLTLAAVKFIIVPAATVSLAWALGIRGPTLAVVMVCAAMPLANFAVVGAAYYRLEEDRVAAVWIFTMALMPLVVSLLAVLVEAGQWGRP